MGVRIDAPLVGPWTSSTAYADPQPCAGGLQCGYYGGPSFHPAMGISASIPIAWRLRLRFDPIYQRIGISNSSYTFDYQSAAVNSPIGEVVSKASITANRWQVTGLIEAGFLRHLRVWHRSCRLTPNGHGTDSQACRSILRNFHIRGTSFLILFKSSDGGSGRCDGVPFPFWKRNARSRTAIQALVRQAL